MAGGVLGERFVAYLRREAYTTEKLARMSKPELPEGFVEPVAPNVEYKPILNVFENAPAPLLRVYFADEEVRVTHNHPWYVRDKGWVASRDLQPGDMLQTPSGECTPVLRVEDHGEIEPVYNIQVKDHHTFYVSDTGKTAALVHNTSPKEAASPDVEPTGVTVFSFLGSHAVDQFDRMTMNVVSPTTSKLLKNVHEAVPWDGLTTATARGVEYVPALMGSSTPLPSSLRRAHAEMSAENTVGFVRTLVEGEIATLDQALVTKERVGRGNFIDAGAGVGAFGVRAETESVIGQAVVKGSLPGANISIAGTNVGDIALDFVREQTLKIDAESSERGKTASPFLETIATSALPIPFGKGFRPGALTKGFTRASPSSTMSTAAKPYAPKGIVDKAWKAKIHGTAQKTGTRGHQFRMYREAIKEAKKPNVTSVHLDHGYNRALGLDPKTIGPNRRPDVVSIYDNNSVLRVEVQSKTDLPAVLRSRNSALDKQLISEGYVPLPPRVIKPNSPSVKFRK